MESEEITLSKISQTGRGTNTGWSYLWNKEIQINNIELSIRIQNQLPNSGARGVGLDGKVGLGKMVKGHW